MENFLVLCTSTSEQNTTETRKPKKKNKSCYHQNYHYYHIPAFELWVKIQFLPIQSLTTAAPAITNQI